MALPVFGIIFTGFLARHFGLLGQASAEALNRFVYYIALPPLLFLSTARNPVGALFNWPFIGAYVGGVALTLLAAISGARLWFGHRDLATLTLHGMAAIFANTVYIGIPLFLAAFGPDGTLPILTAALVSNLLFIGAAVVLLEIYQASGGGYRQALRNVAQALMLSPIIAPACIGLLVAYLALPVPVPLHNFCKLLADAASPSALFALGLSLYGYPLNADKKEIGWLVFLKLLLNPLLTGVLVYVVFTLEPFWADSAVLIAAIPTGALVFVMAQQYGVYVQRSAAVIVVSTALSLFTLSTLLAWYSGR